MIWLAFFEIIIVASSIFGSVFPVYLHVFLGFVIFALAFNNLRLVTNTNAPDRIKRIVRSILGMSAFEGLLGLILFVNTTDISIPFTDIIIFLHLVVSLIILAQSSSAATGYDMWEEKEFT